MMAKILRGADRHKISAMSAPAKPQVDVAERIELVSDSVVQTRSNSSGPEVSAPPSTSITIIEARRGWRPFDLGEIWHYRDLLFFLAWRDVKVRYKQTALGAAWAIIQPLMTMVVLTIAFGKLGKMAEHTTMPY